MVALFDSETGAKIGRINEAQLKALIDWMEEESESDRDYYISSEEVELMEEDGIDPGLIALLRQALAGRDDMDIRYSESDE